MWRKRLTKIRQMSAIFCGPSFFHPFNRKDEWMKQFVFSTLKLFRRTDKLVLICKSTESSSASKQLRTKKRQILIIRWRSSSKRQLRIKKRSDHVVGKKKTVERRNNFLAGICLHVVKMWRKIDTFFGSIPRNKFSLLMHQSALNKSSSIYIHCSNGFHMLNDLFQISASQKITWT